MSIATPYPGTDENRCCGLSEPCCGIRMCACDDCGKPENFLVLCINVSVFPFNKTPTHINFHSQQYFFLLKAQITNHAHRTWFDSAALGMAFMENFAFPGKAEIRF